MTTKNKKEFSSQRIIELSAINNDPYELSEFPSYNNRWVNYGEDNLYLENCLRDAYLHSPTNQAVIDGIVNLATGEGVQVVDSTNNPMSNKFINENFPKETIKKMIADLKTYGFCVIEVYGATCKYREAIRFRSDVADENGNINYMWYSRDWAHYSQKLNKPVKIPLFKEGVDADLSVIVAQLDKKGFIYYSPVDYHAGMNYIQLEGSLSVLHQSNVANGLFPGLSITFFGTEFSDEQMNKIEKDVQKKWGGASNTNRVMLNFASAPELATKVEPIEQTNISEQFTFITAETTEKILLAHGVNSPLLFGIRTGNNGLGSNSEELQMAFYLFYESKLKHYQEYIITLIKRVMASNLLYADVEFITYNPFANTENTQQLAKIEEVTEVNSVDILARMDEIKTKPTGHLTLEKLMTKNSDKTSLYKFIKTSTNNNIIIKKFEILDKKGFLFKHDTIIKNCSDYCFFERKYVEINK
jgi:hypothetical protein